MIRQIGGAAGVSDDHAPEIHPLGRQDIELFITHGGRLGVGQDRHPGGTVGAARCPQAFLLMPGDLIETGGTFDEPGSNARGPNPLA
jgi:hypothetical protein